MFAASPDAASHSELKTARTVSKEVGGGGRRFGYSSFTGPEGELRARGVQGLRYGSPGLQGPRYSVLLTVSPLGPLPTCGQGRRLRRCRLRHGLAARQFSPAGDPVEEVAAAVPGVGEQGARPLCPLLRAARC